MKREPVQRSGHAGEPAASADRASAPSERAGLVVRPGLFLTAVIMSALAAGFAIYWLLRSMHI